MLNDPRIVLFRLQRTKVEKWKTLTPTLKSVFSDCQGSKTDTNASYLLLGVILNMTPDFPARVCLPKLLNLMKNLQPWGSA